MSERSGWEEVMSFARTLRHLIKKAKTRPYELSSLASIDYKHVIRLTTGNASNPQRDTIVWLGQSLLDLSGKITLDDIDKLLTAAGKGALRRERLIIQRS